MLNTPKMTLMQELIAGSSREELIWLSGYLAGVVAQNNAPAPVAVPSATPAVAAANLPKITVAYGTETGNSKKLATDLAARAKKKGIQAKLVGLEQYRLGDLSKEEYFFAVISTQGDGEPPAAAKKFYDHIHQGGLKLERLKYGVLALGDTSYPLFCKAGEDVDVQLHKMGGQRLLSLRKLDTDYETEANAWIDSVLQQLNGPAAAPAAVTTAAPAPKIGAGKKTWVGTVLANINLNDRGSAKQTHHIEIAAEDVDYQPGDSIGIIPANPVVLVEAIIGLTGADAGKRLLHRTEEHPLQHLLHRKLNIVYLPERVVRKYAGIVKQEIPETKIGLLDLLKIYPVKDIDQFHAVVGILEPIAPRLYSISSSPEAHPGEIHLTVARDNFFVNGDLRFGLCSDGLSQLAVGDSVEFYVHRNTRFRLPAEDSDLIMIGPGTGIAPFRSFLAERDSKGASGKNWLFFGDQHFTTDFLYQTEMQDWVKTGVLTHIHTAFSRDQKEKVYVQHKMQKHSAELYRWLESGAHVYICGAREPMSVDVENTLLSIIQQEGGKNTTQAETYLEELKEAGRFVKDVY
ncbi:MAG TPA: flavodoxin domain-containing protein [Puia sp.]|uniref:diflavin oxidoreductase n=1 Tax=Puia sp. TaxID=2045100 RepID=UPI002B5FA6CD|nr:flavodoxin domain-containing protein [Puia sp.]HVU96581.1 flavodoxin domain-containing protein [Puia sp.]